MSDMATVRQMVADEWKESVTGLADEINNSICQALVDLRPLETSFNVGTFTFDTVIGQQAYSRHVKGVAKAASEIRWDFWGVRNKQIKLDVGKAGTDIRILRDLTDDQLDRNTWIWNANTVPTGFTVRSRQILLAQPPSSVDTASGSCILDLETPRAYYDGSAWQILGADGRPVPQLTQAWSEDNSGAPDYTSIVADLIDQGGNDASPFPAGSGANDSVYVGMAQPFDKLTFRVGTAGVGTYTVTWEYYNGAAWVALGGVTDGTTGFKTAGENTLVFTRPVSWTKTSLDTETATYYVRARRDSGTVTTDPILSQCFGDLDDFTNSWFTEATSLLASRAAYRLLNNHLHDKKRADMALDAYKTELHDLKKGEAPFKTMGQVRPFLG